MVCISYFFLPRVSDLSCPGHPPDLRHRWCSPPLCQPRAWSWSSRGSHRYQSWSPVSRWCPPHRSCCSEGEGTPLITYNGTGCPVNYRVDGETAMSFDINNYNIILLNLQYLLYSVLSLFFLFLVLRPLSISLLPPLPSPGLEK